MSDLSTYNIYALNERAAVIELGNIIDQTLNNKVLAIQSWLTKHPFPGLRDLIPAYTSLTVLYDPFYINEVCSPAGGVFEYVKEKLLLACQPAVMEEASEPRTVSIPVCYDPAMGYDIKLVAAAKNLRIEELIHLHCASTYRIYMVGFLPGFPYMGRLDERLVMPRKSVPRPEVEAGSVAIAGWQTGIYPVRSPGGWQVIGRTPFKLFDPFAPQPVVLSAGDNVRFFPISRSEFQSYEKNQHVNNHH
jgi:inhibitor of KinA